MQRAQLTQFVLKLDREQKPEKTRQHSTEGRLSQAVQARGNENDGASSRPVVLYAAIALSSVLLVASIWVQPGSQSRATPDWRPVVALADRAREHGEVYNAKALYAQAGKIAASRQDWTGLLAAACGMKKLEPEKSPKADTHSLLLRAMLAAEAQQSRLGLAAAAEAFTALGERNVASMVAARAHENWQKTTASPQIVSSACWSN